VTWGQLATAIAGVNRGPARAVSRPNQLYPIAAVGDFFGLQGDMLPVTRAEAMSVPAMARARHLVVSPARLPITITPGTYPAAALIDQPDPKRTRIAVLTDTLDDLLFEGMALWRVTDRYAPPAADTPGRPRHAERIALHRVTRDPHDEHYLIDDKPVDDVDLIWFEGPHEGVLRFGGRALRSAVRLDRAYAAMARTPAVAVELHQTSDDILDETEVDELVADAEEAVNTRGVLFTNNALELRTHEAKAENLLISGRNAAAVDIARMVGLPAPIIDAITPGSSGTYSNLQAKLREARDIGLDAYAAAVTSRLSLDDLLPRGVWCAFDWEPWIRPDFLERMNGYSAAQAAGVYDVDECRALERGRPLEGP
jgi:hypothetical protein